MELEQSFALLWRMGRDQNNYIITNHLKIFRLKISALSRQYPLPIFPENMLSHLYVTTNDLSGGIWAFKATNAWLGEGSQGGYGTVPGQGEGRAEGSSWGVDEKNGKWSTRGTLPVSVSVFLSVLKNILDHILRLFLFASLKIRPVLDWFHDSSKSGLVSSAD